MLTLAAIKLVTHLYAGAVLATMPAATAIRDPSWVGVQKLLIIAQSDGSAATGISAETLCRRAQTIAAVGAPVSVSCTTIGDPALRAPRTAVLAVQAAAATGSNGGKVLLLTVRRADESGLEPAPVYFGSMLRAVPIAHGATAELDHAIGDSLRQVLPWLGSDDQLKLNNRGGD